MGGPSCKNPSTWGSIILQTRQSVNHHQALVASSSLVFHRQGWQASHAIGRGRSRVQAFIARTSRQPMAASLQSTAPSPATFGRSVVWDAMESPGKHRRICSAWLWTSQRLAFPGFCPGASYIAQSIAQPCRSGMLLTAN